jgi:hypothetical protein
MNPAAQDPELRQKFKELYVDYKLAVTAEHFAPTADANRTAWHGPAGETVLPTNPVLARLATPKLSSDLATHLQRK